jgi:hypothetical protein
MCAGVLCAAVFFAGGGVASARQQGSCSTSGLAPASSSASRYKVVSLGAAGVPCSKARTVAQQVADELTHGRPISVAGVQEFAINTLTCTGCKPTTQVALTYATGKITISLGGKASSASLPAPSPIAPTGSGPLVIA